MIFDSLANIDNYRNLPAIHQALKYLQSISLANLPSGTVEIDGQTSTARVTQPTTRPISECRFEAHRQYIDIHCTLDGLEGIAVRDVAALEPLGDFDVAKDVGFYHGEQHAIGWLYPGEFMVCFPKDAHMPGIMQDAPLQFTKVIIKIAVTA